MEPEALRSSYDAVADVYAQKFFDELSRKPFDRDLLARFAQRCPPGLVLDIGCGPGHVGRFLSDLGLDVTGVDLSPEMVRAARKLNPGMTFEVGDMRHLAHDDTSVAGLTAFYSLIHIRRPDVPAVLREFGRVLMRGGKILLAVHGGTGSIKADELLGRRARFEATLFERTELAGLLQDAGFEVDEVHQRERYDFETHTPRVYVAATKP